MADAERVTFHYLKSEAHRTVHTDGVYGGVTPRGLIAMSLYSERSAIPQVIEYDVEEGRLSERERAGKEGLVREIEVTALLDLNLARSLQTWLSEKIAILESLEKRESEDAPS